MDQQWINLSNCKLPGLGTVAPRGAHFFHIIILYYFHGGSSTLVNRPGVAGAVLQSPPWLTDWLINCLSDGLWKYIQNLVNPKPEEVESWKLRRMFIPHNVSHVMCHLSCVTCKKKKYYPSEKNGQNGGISQWRVCYQQGLPRLVNRPGVAGAVLHSPP